MKLLHGLHAKAFLLSLAGIVAACGVDTAQSPLGSKKASSEDANSASEDSEEKPVVEEEDTLVDHLVVPPKEYYSQLMLEDAAKIDQGLELGATNQPQVMFINFDGATLKKGFGKEQSFILCKSEATIPSSNLSAAQRTQVMEAVALHYETAGAKLVITDQKPTSGDFTTIIVGGSYSSLGCLGGGVLGVAPFDVGNQNRNDIGFAFMPQGISVRVIAETISHEAGHSFGLNHVVSSKDIMYASSSSNVDKFGVSQVSGGGSVQDAPKILVSVLGAFDGNNLPGGGSNPNPNPNPAPTPNPQPGPQPSPTPGNGGNLPLPGNLGNIPGLDKLAAIIQLLPILNGGLDLSKLLPMLQNLLPGLGSGNLPGLDKILQLQTLLDLLKGGGGAPYKAGFLPGLDIGIMLALVQGILADPSTLDALKALLNLGQNQNLVAILQKLLSGGLGGLGGGQLPSLPDLCNLLNISKNNSPTTLLSQFRATTQHIQGQYVGDERDALLSLVKLAYAQALAEAK